MTNFAPTPGETRYPFLDQTLTEFLASIPADQLLRPGERRSLMRRALTNLVPNEILSRSTKQLETRGYIVTLRKHWEELQGVLASPASSDLGYVKVSEFQAALIALKNGHLSRESMMLLRGLFLELWLRSLMKQDIIVSPGRAAPSMRRSRSKSIEVSASRSP
jgi:asparagine synthase (glutamine-hydrolysing)